MCFQNDQKLNNVKWILLVKIQLKLGILTYLKEAKKVGQDCLLKEEKNHSLYANATPLITHMVKPK